MKIIKEGVIQEPKKYAQFECGKCGTIFECEKDECEYEVLLDNQGISWNDGYNYNCPLCKRRCFVSAKEFKQKLNQ